jgi:hypothetical protein
MGVSARSLRPSDAIQIGGLTVLTGETRRSPVRKTRDEAADPAERGSENWTQEEDLEAGFEEVGDREGSENP